MTVSIRSLLNPELKIASMPSEWLREEILALLIMSRGVLVAALRHVPEARDCPRVGLGAEQCVGVAKNEHPVTAILLKAARRGVTIYGCDVYAVSPIGPEQVRRCVRAGIKRIYYSCENAQDDEIEELQAVGMEIIRVKI